MIWINLRRSPPSSAHTNCSGRKCVHQCIEGKFAQFCSTERCLCWAQLKSEANSGSGLWLAESHHESLFPLDSRKANRSTLLDTGTATVHRMCCCWTSRWCFCWFSIGMPHKCPTAFVSNHADTRQTILSVCFIFLQRVFETRSSRRKKKFFPFLGFCFSNYSLNDSYIFGPNHIWFTHLHKALQ